jgi:hypothetical protein
VITAIRATSRTLADHLQSEFASDPDLGPFFSGGGSMRVLLNTPAEMTGARSGLSVWLYRVTRDELTLNRPPERIGPTTVRPAPLPVRLHYLISPITGVDADDATATEQVILGKVLQVLHEHPQLSGVDLKDDLQGTRAVITARFESLNVDELARIWDALERPYRTSISFEVTVVDIEARTRDEVGPPVEVPLLDPVLIVSGGAP